MCVHMLLLLLPLNIEHSNSSVYHGTNTDKNGNIHGDISFCSLYRQFYIFINIEDYKLDRAYIEGSDVFGGPGNTQVVATPVFFTK